MSQRGIGWSLTRSRDYRQSRGTSPRKNEAGWTPAGQVHGSRSKGGGQGSCELEGDG